jgi:hypothetical protein
MASLARNHKTSNLQHPSDHHPSENKRFSSEMGYPGRHLGVERLMKPLKMMVKIGMFSGSNC